MTGTSVWAVRWEPGWDCGSGQRGSSARASLQAGGSQGHTARKTWVEASHETVLSTTRLFS